MTARAVCPDCGKRARCRPVDRDDVRGDYRMAAHARPGDAEVSPWQTCIGVTRIPADAVEVDP